LVRGYWIAHADVTDPAGYERYRAANAEAFRKFGATFLVRGGRSEVVEGASRSRHVLIEFRDRDVALACYRSPEYQRASAFRGPSASLDLIVIAGYAGPQPSAAAGEAATDSTRGYWVAHADVAEPEGYKAYMAADMGPIGQFGGRFLVRGGAFEKMEGSARSRAVIVAFPSYAAALACYRSRDYQAAAALRQGKAEFDLIACEGYDGRQP
jgi:uncharacterized protein (DUF1330 family)